MRLAAVAAAMLPLAAAAVECVVRSGPQTAALVELYTSEGCSSCPPADRWISKLATRPSTQVVPVAFHVTYWDHIGWRDPFASERHTARQRERASASGARYVYTPQVVVGGRDFREWPRGGAFESAVEKINRTPAQAEIELRIAADRVEAKATPRTAAPPRDLALVLALTQNGLSSRVTAGENRGEHLEHDFVVRGLAESRTLTASLSFKPPARPGSAAIAAFVQDRKTGEILQALSAPLCR